MLQQRAQASPRKLPLPEGMGDSNPRMTDLVPLVVGLI